MNARPPNQTLRKQTMSVILNMDLDYFPLFDQPLDDLERLLTRAGCPVDFLVQIEDAGKQTRSARPPPRLSAPRRAAIHGCLARSTVAVGGGRPP